MKVCIYARFSTTGQDKTSIAGQVANCEALAAREGLQIGATFHDEAQSGNDDNRPNYRAMLERLKRGEFDGVIADETSRLTRSQAELHRLVAELKFRDQFIATVDGVDTRNESAEIVLSVKAAIDAMEGRKIGTRTYRSLRERHKDGHSAGGRIYGFGSVQDGDYKRRVVNPEQAKVVLAIFTRYADGASAKTIARELNERRVPSPGAAWNGKKRRAIGWAHVTIVGCYSKASGILRNPAYTGRITWNKRAGKKVPGTGMRIQKRRPESEWIEVQDESLRIVPDELWQRVQARLRAARQRNHAVNLKGRPARHLLSGLLVCACCGAHYVVRNGKSYTCSSLSNGRDSLCTQRTYLPREETERELLRDITAQLLEPKLVERRTRQIQKANRKPRTNGSDLKALDKQIADVVDTLVAVGKSDALTAKLRELEKQRRALLQATAQPARIVPGAADQWHELVSKLEHLHQYATPDEMETARLILRESVAEVSIVEDEKGVYADTRMIVGAGYKCGAEEPAPDLYLERTKLKDK
jgi:DNA invertase Pin-like site-specific DNA recombinase